MRCVIGFTIYEDIILPWSLFLRLLSLQASLVFDLLSISETLDVSLAYFDFSSLVHTLESNVDLNHNDDNASRRQLPLYIHYQILLVYSIQSFLYSLVLSTPLVSGRDSHLTFSLENFFLIDSACSVHNSTILDNVYLEIEIHFLMKFSYHLMYCHNSVCCSYM